MTDTRFSSAIHTLIMIAGAEAPLTSEQIANSVGTNPSYIRKLTALLKKGGILAGRPGVGGFVLRVPPQTLTLYDVYRAIYETKQVHVFDLHRNANDALTQAFQEIEEKAENELKAQTLSGLMAQMRKEICKGAKTDY